MSITIFTCTDIAYKPDHNFIHLNRSMACLRADAVMLVLWSWAATTSAGGQNLLVAATFTYMWYACECASDIHVMWMSCDTQVIYMCMHACMWMCVWYTCDVNVMWYTSDIHVHACMHVNVCVIYMCMHACECVCDIETCEFDWVMHVHACEGACSVDVHPSSLQAGEKILQPFLQVSFVKQ